MELFITGFKITSQSYHELEIGKNQNFQIFKKKYLNRLRFHQENASF